MKFPLVRNPLTVILVSALAVLLPACSEASRPTPSSPKTNVYDNIEYGYSIVIPEGIHALGDLGAGPAIANFATEVVSSGVELSPGNMWVTIRSEASPNPDDLESILASRTHPQAETTRRAQLLVGGVPAVQQVENYTAAQDTHPGVSLVTLFYNNGFLHTASGVTDSLESIAANEGVYNLVLENLEFANDEN